MIPSGDGYVEFTVGERDTIWLAGLSRSGADSRFSDIEFAFRFNGAGRADVMENGVYEPGGDTTYATGDVFRVAIVGGRVGYIKNGQLLHESRRVPRYPLGLATALRSLGATIRHARIETSEGALTRFGSPSDRFTELDFDDDGIVSLREWDGTRRAFERADVNRDGRLTRRELGGGEPDAVATSGQMVRVDATQRWTNTGLYIEAGDTITFDAQGTIRMSPDPNDSAMPAGSTVGRFAPDAPLRQEPAGSLIARIGDSVPVLIGDRRVIRRASVTGTLYLGVNDDHLLDNSGEYRVVVMIDRR